LAEKPEGKRPHGRNRCRWEDNIKIDLQEMWVEVDSILLAKNRKEWQAVVNAIMNIRVP
jgi:hypothetical protein